MLSHDFGRDQLDDKRNAKWDEEQVVHIANDRMKSGIKSIGDAA